MNKKKHKRIYAGITDSQMLTGAETMRDLFEKDQAQFLAFDAIYDTTFKEDWDEKIEEARHSPTDDAVNASISVTDDGVNEAWNACKIHFQDAKYFIGKAFGRQAEQNEFGSKNYEKMCRNPLKVLPFMDQFHAAAEKYKTALIAQGYTQEKIDEIETLGGNFHTASRTKKRTKKDRFQETDDRITKMNAVWQKLKTVNRASKNIFKTDNAKQKQYLLPRKQK